MTIHRSNPSIHTENDFEVPETLGVQLHHIMTANFSAGTIDHVVKEVGDPADVTKIGVPVNIVDYPLLTTNTEVTRGFTKG